MKSFVQRRGRARRVHSSFIIMYSNTERNKAQEFEEIEKEMKILYSDPLRTIEYSPNKHYDIDQEAGANIIFKIENTGYENSSVLINLLVISDIDLF
jgi:hypothetical protein